MDALLAIRKEWGKPMKITSGYRHWSHPVEARKGHKNGEHTKGLCADVAISGGVEAAQLALIAIKHGSMAAQSQHRGADRHRRHPGLRRD